MAKFYWLKLPENWFQQKAIKKLRRIAGGDTYTIIYLKMLLKAIKQDSRLFYEGVEDNFHEEIALDIDEDPENVKITLAYLESQHLIEIAEENEFSLPEAQKLTGSESDSAERVRRYRERKALQCNAAVTGGNEPKCLCNREIEIEIEIEKDNHIYSPVASSGPYKRTEKISPGRVSEVVGHPTAANAQGIGTRAGSGAKGIGTMQSGGVEVVDASRGTIDPQDVFIELPLIGGKVHQVSKKSVTGYKELYPAVDVEQALRNMLGWLRSNPKNRKTEKGIERFINGWLSREQNRAPRVSTYSSSAKKKASTWSGMQNDYTDEEFRVLEQELTSLPKTGI